MNLLKLTRSTYLTQKTTERNIYGNTIAGTTTWCALVRIRTLLGMCRWWCTGGWSCISRWWCTSGWSTRSSIPTHLLNSSAMEKDHSCQCQKSISCLSNYASCRSDIWPMQWRTRCKDKAIRVLDPCIGSVLGHPPTDPLKLQVRKIVHVFMQDELRIQLSKEIQGHFPVVMRWWIKDHIPSIHLVIDKWLVYAPLNGYMWPVCIWYFSSPRILE